ncbi:MULTISPECIES: hypothetical protein [unclassified Streptomyces]|uniref:hypothetical protein n=1 Tax=unclassified Streptomyces TaxID=2593676 RepID=UPI003797D1CC
MSGEPASGATRPTTRERIPRGEAVHYRERAIELGVPSSAVLVESRARTLNPYVNSIGDARLVIDMLVGALQRLAIYPDQGFMIRQPVPVDVSEGYQRLRQSGFTSRLLATDSPST